MCSIFITAHNELAQLWAKSVLLYNGRGPIVMSKTLIIEGWLDVNWTELETYTLLGDNQWGVGESDTRLVTCSERLCRMSKEMSKWDEGKLLLDDERNRCIGRSYSMVSTVELCWLLLCCSTDDDSRWGDQGKREVAPEKVALSRLSVRALVSLSTFDTTDAPGSSSSALKGRKRWTSSSDQDQDFTAGWLPDRVWGRQSEFPTAESPTYKTAERE